MLMPILRPRLAIEPASSRTRATCDGVPEAVQLIVAADNPYAWMPKFGDARDRRRLS